MALILFNSLEFGVFFLLVFSVYFLLPHRWQNWLLLIASYVFYGWWNWRLLSLIGISTLVDYLTSLGINHSPSQLRRRLLLLLSLTTNLSILGTFKYFNFFADSLETILQQIGFNPDIVTLQLALPVGISFYTFQTMSYTIDVYRGRITPTRNLRDFALFVAFFPQLVAGPIERAATLLPQIRRPRRITDQRVMSGLYLVGWGLFKKVIIADTLGTIVDPTFASSPPYQGIDVLLAIYAFSFQIYGDFSGYSDIARGLARILGFNLSLNFNLPYFATNPRAFWERWHITLSGWLRDYLYIPLGGNRHGPHRTYRNLAITMLLGGLWHGAAWTFVVWGAYHGTMLIIHRFITNRRLPPLKLPPSLKQIIKIVLFFHLVALSWLLFRATSLTQAATMAISLITNLTTSSTTAQSLALLAFLVSPLLIINLYQHRHRNLEFVHTIPLSSKALLATLLLFITGYTILYTAGSLQAREFIYFQF